MFCVVCVTPPPLLPMGNNGISSDIWSSLLFFHSIVLPLLPTISNFVYFSFLPVKQRDFPGNVRPGGCDSLPPVVAFTSKQRDSPLSYALHFLSHIIPPNVLRWRKSRGPHAASASPSASLVELQERWELSPGLSGATGSVL